MPMHSVVIVMEGGHDFFVEFFLLFLLSKNAFKSYLIAF